MEIHSNSTHAQPILASNSQVHLDYTIVDNQSFRYSPLLGFKWRPLDSNVITPPLDTDLQNPVLDQNLIMHLKSRCLIRQLKKVVLYRLMRILLPYPYLRTTTIHLGLLLHLTVCNLTQHICHRNLVILLWKRHHNSVLCEVWFGLASEFFNPYLTHI